MKDNKAVVLVCFLFEMGVFLFAFVLAKRLATGRLVWLVELGENRITSLTLALKLLYWLYLIDANSVFKKSRC